MARILVVDDSPVERKLAARLLQQTGDWEVSEAKSAKIALELLQRESFDLILSDICMPDMSGLELLDELKTRHPNLPLIAMTSQGSEEVAVSALERGAASYLSKRLIGRDLVDVAWRVFEAGREILKHDKLQRSLVSCQQTYQLSNEPSLVSSIVQEVQKLATQIGRVEQVELIRIGVAIEEALLNAMIHGNLEVSSELRERGDNAFFELIRKRSQEKPYADRRVRFQFRIAAKGIDLLVRDEGPGFDVSALPDPTDGERLILCSGRGILLMRSFMDEVTYNAAGNQVTLCKFFDAPVIEESENLCAVMA